MADVTVPTPVGQVRAHLAVPSSDGPEGDRRWPAVVLVHEAFGLRPDIRGYAERLAGQGYLALAPDLFSWGPGSADGGTAIGSRAAKLRCVAATMRSLVAREGPGFEVLDATAGWLADRDDCTGRVGVIGFCMGGGFALLAAPRGRFHAAAVNYGQVPKDAEQALDGACPVVGSFGGADRALRGAADRLDRALTQLGVEHNVKEYPGVGHSFLNRHTGSLVALDRTVFRALGAGYDEAAAADAWRRIDDFLARHLR